MVANAVDVEVRMPLDAGTSISDTEKAPVDPVLIAKERDFARKYTDVSSNEVQADGDDEAEFEKRCADLRKLIHGNPAHREIMYKTLRYCSQRRDFADVEDMITTSDEFRSAQQSPFRIITYLVDAKGLEQYAVDAEGEDVTSERCEGLTEDEVDELIASYQFVATDAGNAVAQEAAPSNRLSKLATTMPDRKKAFMDVLGFCQESRSIQEIVNLFDAADLAGIKSLNTASSVPVKASSIVEKLERAGGLVWNDGWRTTREGAAFLGEMMK
ncbi:hypothetical protein [Denitrobacterium detoxificans]|jgi:hypothetical protein|uniref:hypothetical protein n=1 Tax=Denitrobacterium detoxificans TaxID=79604 RepID=UPI0026F126CD|nr:hypothetical protein [Denitrobacterium detoxificans]MBE6466764.1 hypothetical protein [Denitrobacterium detoxificans]